MARNFVPVTKVKRDNRTLEQWGKMCLEGAYGQHMADSSFSTAEANFVSHVQGSKLGGMKIRHIRRRDVQEFANGIRAKKVCKVSSQSNDGHKAMARMCAAAIDKALPEKLR